MRAAKSCRTEADRVYVDLHRAIVRGELQPHQRLIELELAERFGVGRAAVRTALDRLAHDGLVEREPNRGAHVRFVAPEEAVEMVEARAALEGLAARYAARNATQEAIGELRDIIDAMEERVAAGDLLAYSDLNAQLHASVVRIAGHSTVARLLERLQADNVRHQYRMILAPGRAQQSLQEHRSIVDAVAAHDEQRAEATMRIHLAHSAEALRRNVSAPAGRSAL